MENWKSVFETALVHKLSQASQDFFSKKLKSIDIGVFPWHSSIELSLLFVGEDCDAKDIAAWPHYDYSAFNEGRWPRAAPVAQALNRLWENDKDIGPLLANVAELVRTEKIQTAICQFDRASDFSVQIMNADGDAYFNFYV